MDNYIEETKLPGVFIIKRPVFKDGRGFFRETFRKSDLEKRLGYEFNPVQANHARSEKGILRGIHIAPWHKLVTIIRGKAQQVVVDLREDSKTFSQHVSLELGENNFESVFIPANCGNAYLVLSDEVDYTYLTSKYWLAGKERSIIYHDKLLNINWQTNSPILSEKDKLNPTIGEVFPYLADKLNK